MGSEERLRYGWRRRSHPTYCTCADCVERRLWRVEASANPGHSHSPHGLCPAPTGYASTNPDTQRPQQRPPPLPPSWLWFRLLSCDIFGSYLELLMVFPIDPNAVDLINPKRSMGGGIAATTIVFVKLPCIVKETGTGDAIPSSYRQYAQ